MAVITRLFVLIALIAATVVPTAAGEASGDVEELYRQGVAAMRASDNDPSKSVDAAILLTQAKELYEAEENWDKVREVNSYIFWCKKRMNNSELDAYLARIKGKKPPAEVAEVKRKLAKTLEKVDKVVNTKVTKSEATTYMLRADRFAKKNEDKHFEIHVRYLEVAERFGDIDMQVATKAMRKSSDHLRKYAQVVKKRAGEVEEKARLVDAKVATLFSKPATVSTSGLPVPDSNELRSVIRDLQRDYRSLYRSRRPEAKKELADMFFEKAQKSKDEPTICYAMASEAAALAGESGVQNVALILKVGDFLSATFKGVDPVAEKKQFLRSAKTTSTTRAAIELLENPADPEANTEVGMNFCFSQNDFDNGLKMLAIGEDEDLRKLAQQEMTKIRAPTRMKEIADGWYEAAEERSWSDYREAILAHCLDWYRKAIKNGLKGASKDMAERRLAEVEMQVPLDLSTINWKKHKLSEREWHRIKAPIVEVNAKQVLCDTGLQLETGQVVRVVPHPTDEWEIIEQWGDRFRCTWRGDRNVTYAYGGWYDGEMGLSKAKTGALQKVGEFHGPGHLYIRRHDDECGIGVIRVKIVPIKVD
jgi:hypothetical protein